MLQQLSSSRAPRANGQLLTTSFGRIIDPAVDTVEATLETGAVVQAQTSEQSFLVLVQGSHAVCELRALAASGRLLERIPGQEPQCPGQ